ncbi:hypothetical protein OG21DRAFT_1526458 [Imleria badia]|nr:hypothetical protein OG21DRAFT_1526458 [Imleria badia]
MLPTPEPTQDEEKVHTFNVSLTVYTLLKKAAYRGTRKVATVKEEKLVKVKELPFAINEDNYIDFLTSLLEKHGQEQYKVSEKCCFPFKYVLPKSKNQRSSDGMDIDNESDYKEMNKPQTERAQHRRHDEGGGEGTVSLSVVVASQWLGFITGKGKLPGSWSGYHKGMGGGMIVHYPSPYPYPLFGLISNISMHPY